jgi:tripartite-type tricarboxylate transporter receptor subunit TctC
MTTQTKGRVQLISAVLLCCAAAAGSPAHAQPFPNKPIKVVVPYPPGGGPDVTARLINERLSKALGQQVLVENIAGAGGGLGVAAAARASADGYTLLFTNSSPFTVNPVIYKELAYKLEQFSPVIEVSKVPLVLVVRPGLAANSVPELLELAKTAGLRYGSFGVGSTSHLWGATLARSAGVEMDHIPYTRLVQATQDVATGKIDFVFVDGMTAATFLASSKVKALAVTGARRSKQFPEVSTIAEQGIKGFELVGWFGYFVPAAVPATLINKLNEELRAVLTDEELQKRLVASGSNVVAGSAKDFSQVIEKDKAQTVELVRAVNIKVE